MSRTPASASLDGYVIVASQLSNVPSMATEALTANRTELPSFVIWMTGISPGVCTGIKGKGETNDRKQEKAIWTVANLRFFPWLIIQGTPFSFSLLATVVRFPEEAQLGGK